jgi:hypothetical protein
MKDDDPDKYLDPEYNPFIPRPEPPARPDNPFDLTSGLAPFGPVSSGGELGALLDKAHPEGGHVEVGGVKLLRLLEWAFEDGTSLAEASPVELARIRKALG